MRPFWQFIALLLLALFVPGTMHCLPGANAQVHVVDVLQLAMDGAQGQSCCADSQEMTAHPSGDSESQHPCPSQTLAQTQLPALLKAPAQPQPSADDDAALHPWMMAFAAMLQQLHASASSSDSFSASAVRPDVPAQLRAGWAFRLRAALPARMPSDLV